MVEEVGASRAAASGSTASSTARALLVAALVALLAAESHGLVISAVKAELYDDIPWQSYLASEWAQRLIMTPVILAAAVTAGRSRGAAAVVAAVVVGWAIACALIPAELPPQTYPWVRLDSYGWELEDPPGVRVLPGEITPIRVLGIALCGLAAGGRACLPATGRIGRWASGATVAIVAAGALAVSSSVLFESWFSVLQDALHALGIVVGVALLMAGRRGGPAVIAIVGMFVTLSFAWDAVWVRNAGVADLFPLVGGYAVLWLTAVLIAAGAVRARRPRAGFAVRPQPLSDP